MTADHTRTADADAATPALGVDSSAPGRGGGLPLKTLASRVVARVKADDVPSLAAGVAFKIFLSLFPSMIAGVAIVSYVMDDPLEIARQPRVRAVLPPGFVADILEPRLEGVAEAGGTAAVALLVGLLGGLWAATSAAATLIKALNRINGVLEHRGFLVQRAVALMVILALLLVLLVVAALIVFESPLREWLLPPQLGAAGTLLFRVVQIGVLLGALVSLFAFIYSVGPNRERLSREWISAGSITGVVGWLVLSLAFRGFVQTLGTYEQTYGSLAAVAITMLWLQLSMMMLLLGAEVDVLIRREHETEEALIEGAGMGMVEPLPVGPAVGPLARSSAGGSGTGPAAGSPSTIDTTRTPRTVAAVAGLGALAAAVGVAVRGRR